ncbi:MAG: hypothetical protein ACLFWB_01875 [Armatimonadota bacterium]
MKTAWQIALGLGILSLLLGIIDHFLGMGGSPGVFGFIATPEAFMQFAGTAFLLAVVFQLGLILQRMNGKSETGE